MLLYYLFWMFMGFTLEFYIIFRTNLNRRPSPYCCFFAYFSVSKKRNIKRSPNGMKPSGAIFLEQTWSRGLGVEVKKQVRRTWGCPTRPYRWVRPPPSWTPPLLLDVHPKSPGSRLFQKDRSRRFHSVWTPFDIPFLRNTKIGKKK